MQICESVWRKDGSSVKQCSPNLSLKYLCGIRKKHAHLPVMANLMFSPD